MAMTDFASMQPQRKVVWARQLWKHARDMAFISRFVGTGPNNIIQRITELTKTEKGDLAIMQLLADLQGDGNVGDGEREGHEEDMMSYSDQIQIDLMNHGVTNKGKLSDQKGVIRFRENARDVLAYWLANRLDQLAILTLSGVSYSYHNNGALRSSSNFPSLSFAADVSAPSANRYLVWDATGFGVNTANSQLAAADTPTYEMIVDLVAFAKDHYVRPLISAGKEYYVLLVKPGTLAKLKLDDDYQRAVVTGGPRGTNNPWFTGGTVTIDGAVIHEHRLTYSTLGAVAPNKWGGSGDVDGSRTLLLGAQAMGMCDLGPPEWVEKLFQYDSRQGINVDKMAGFLKPKFYSPYDGSVEDFGVVAVDHAL